jgi:hypothetical protein
MDVDAQKVYNTTIEKLFQSYGISDITNDTGQNIAEKNFLDDEIRLKIKDLCGWTDLIAIRRIWKPHSWRLIGVDSCKEKIFMSNDGTVPIYDSDPAVLNSEEIRKEIHQYNFELCRVDKLRINNIIRLSTGEFKRIKSYTNNCERMNYKWVILRRENVDTRSYVITTMSRFLNVDCFSLYY